MTGLRQSLAVVIGLATSLSASAESIRIAAAANFQTVMPPLIAAFVEAHPEVTAAVSYASSGNLVAQIRHGAPFDVLLSADLEYPRALITSGDADASTLTTFAFGVLMLWPDPPDEDWVTALRSPKIRHVAIANPDTAPYGAAAEQALVKAGLYEALSSRLVLGENAAQALQFVHRGHANYGLVPASLLAGNNANLGQGRVIELGDDALPHGAILLNRGTTLAGAHAFMAWLSSPTTREILLEHGYRLP